jgi:hypothetical protein
MSKKLNEIQKYILDGALTLWVDAFNQERQSKTEGNKISLFGADYAEIMANEIRNQLKIEKDEPSNEYNYWTSVKGSQNARDICSELNKMLGTNCLPYCP